MYIRNCKNCGREITHKDEKNLKRALRLDKICIYCSNKIKSTGENNSMFGKTHNEETKQKIREKRKLQIFSIETFEKMSIAGKRRCEEYNHWIGRTHKDSTKEKMRIISAQRIHNHKWHPSFNIEACNVIQNYGKKYGYNFQHALNGGEFYIKNLGYWVDGYDIEQNVVIEYYENAHKYYIEKDEIRIQNIKNHLNCDVIILREWNDDDIKLINELK